MEEDLRPDIGDVDEEQSQEQHSGEYLSDHRNRSDGPHGQASEQTNLSDE